MTHQPNDPLPDMNEITAAVAAFGMTCDEAAAIMQTDTFQDLLQFLALFLLPGQDFRRKDTPNE